MNMENWLQRLKYDIYSLPYLTFLITFKAQERRISDRDELIRRISELYNIKGYSHMPLEREKVVEFMARLADLLRKQRSEYDKVQVSSMMSLLVL